MARLAARPAPAKLSCWSSRSCGSMLNSVPEVHSSWIYATSTRSQFQHEGTSSIPKLYTYVYRGIAHGFECFPPSFGRERHVRMFAVGELLHSRKPSDPFESRAFKKIKNGRKSNYHQDVKHSESTFSPPQLLLRHPCKCDSLVHKCVSAHTNRSKQQTITNKRPKLKVMVK